MSARPLLVADGDIATTHLFARILRSAHGRVEVRYPETLFGADFARPHVALSRVCVPSHAWLPRYLADRGLGYVYLLDDNFWELTPEVDPYLAAFFAHPHVRKVLDSFVGGARAAVVWSRRLGAEIAARLPGVVVEYLNPSFDTDTANALLGAASPRADDPDVVRIGYPTTRRLSVAPLLEPVIAHITQRFRGRVAFEFVGWMPDGVAALPGVTLFPAIGDYDRYLAFKISRRWDIGLAPLIGSPFDTFKTSVKFREYGGCGVAGVYSMVAPYTDDVVDGATGLLVENRVDAWIEAIERLIASPEERRSLAAGAKAEVARNYSQHASVRRWLEIANAHANR